MQDTSSHDQPRPILRQPEFLRLKAADPAALAALLDKWMQGDATEQRETFEILRRLG